MVVGDTLSGPYATYAVGPFALNLENPYFLRVGNGEAFTAIAVAILLD